MLNHLSFVLLLVVLSNQSHAVTFLHEAILRADFAEVETLLRNGEDPNEPDDAGRTPLEAAFELDDDVQPEIIERLSEYNADFRNYAAPPRHHFRPFEALRRVFLPRPRLVSAEVEWVNLLPHDVWALVFRHLDPGERTHMARMCNRFRHAVSKVRAPLDRNGFGFTDHLPQLGPRRLQVRIPPPIDLGYLPWHYTLSYPRFSQILCENSQCYYVKEYGIVRPAIIWVFDRSLQLLAKFVVGRHPKTPTFTRNFMFIPDLLDGTVSVVSRRRHVVVKTLHSFDLSGIDIRGSRLLIGNSDSLIARVFDITGYL